MYRQEPNEVNILGEMLPKKRRSVFLEGGLDSAHAHNPTKVAPAPIKFINKPSEAYAGSNQRNGAIYEILKPICLLMRIVGIFPISTVEPRVFRLTPRWLGYSTVIFLFVVGYIGYIEWDSVEIERSQEGRFEEAVIDYLFTVYLLPIVINPIVWYEAKKLANVVTDWGKFEKIYNKVTKKKLSIFLGNKPVILSVVLPFISCATMVVTHVTMAEFKVVQV
jgi:gustatory receptor